MKTILLYLILICIKVLEHALSKVDFSVGIVFYMLPGNLILNTGQTVEYNKEIL